MAKAGTGRKTGAKTGRKDNGQYARGSNGGAHGKPGRSGRKPLDFKQECERLTDELVLPKLAACIAALDPTDASWRWAAQFVSDHGKGKPNQTHTHTGTDGGPIQHEVALAELA